LYDLILDSLRACHLKSFQELEFLQAFQQINILILKGLYPEAQQLIDKQKKILKEDILNSSNYEYMLRLIGVEQELAQNHEGRESLQNISEEYTRYLSILRESNQFTKLYARFYKIFDQSPRNPQIKEHYVSLLKDPLLVPDKQHAIFWNQYRYLRIYGTYYEDTKAYDKAYDCALQIIKIIPTPQDTHNENAVVLYAMNLWLYLEQFVYVPKVEEYLFIDALQRLRNISQLFTSKNKLNSRIHTYILISYDCELKYYRYRKEYSKFPKILESLKHNTSSNNGLDDEYKIKNHQNQLAYTYFLMRDYALAYDYSIQAIAKREDVFFVQEFHRSAMLFHVLILFEMGDYQALEQHLPKLELCLEPIEAPFRLELLMITYLRKIVKVAKTVQGNLFEELYQEMLPLLQDPYEQFEQFEFDYWDWVLMKC